MGRFLSRISDLFGKSKGKPADVYAKLRDQVFKHGAGAVDPKSVQEGIAGVVMDLGYPEAVSTLVALADGTVSVYLSNGGAMIGLGSHDGPAAACKKLLSLAPKFIASCAPATRFPLPEVGRVRFHLLTPKEILVAEAREDALNSGKHPLSPLFYAAHSLISECRKVDEKQGRGEAGS